MRRASRAGTIENLIGQHFHRAPLAVNCSRGRDGANGPAFSGGDSRTTVAWSFACGRSRRSRGEGGRCPADRSAPIPSEKSCFISPAGPARSRTDSKGESPSRPLRETGRLSMRRTGARFAPISSPRTRNFLAALERFPATAARSEIVGGERDAPLGTGVTYREMILGALSHDAYHGAQIALLRKAPPWHVTSRTRPSGACSAAASGTRPGATLEFQGLPSPPDVERAMTMCGGGFFRLAPGQITDDAELAISLADALSRSSSFDLEAIARVVRALDRFRPLRRRHDDAEFARFLRFRGRRRLRRGDDASRRAELHGLEGERKPDEDLSARDLGPSAFGR